MAESTKAGDEALKPFYQRASEAEERLSRLEAALANKKDDGNEELSKLVIELQSKLEDIKLEQISERKKASMEIQKLVTENAKLNYRITHLVRAMEEGDRKLESV